MHVLALSSAYILHLPVGHLPPGPASGMHMATCCKLQPRNASQPSWSALLSAIDMQRNCTKQQWVLTHPQCRPKGTGLYGCLM